MTKATVPVPDTASVKVVDVTPDMAAAWLEHNTHNRPVRRAAVDAFTRDMQTGSWQFNGETIKFAADGTLLDGQHRLSAIVAADVTIPFLVVGGLPRFTQETVDGGAKRKFSDVLSLRGEKHATTLSAICRFVCVYERGQRGNLGGGGTTTNSELSATLDLHPWLRDAAARADSVGQHCALPASVIGFAYWLFWTLDAEDADHFFTRLGEDTGWSKGDPIYELRRVAGESNSVRGARDRVYLAAVTIKAWNAYRRGDTVGQLKWRRGGAKPEKFPEPV